MKTQMIVSLLSLVLTEAVFAQTPAEQSKKLMDQIQLSTSAIRSVTERAASDTGAKFYQHYDYILASTEVGKRLEKALTEYEVIIRDQIIPVVAELVEEYNSVYTNVDYSAVQKADLLASIRSRFNDTVQIVLMPIYTSAHQKLLSATLSKYLPIPHSRSNGDIEFRVMDDYNQIIKTKNYESVHPLSVLTYLTLRDMMGTQCVTSSCFIMMKSDAKVIFSKIDQLVNSSIEIKSKDPSDRTFLLTDLALSNKLNVRELSEVNLASLVSKLPYHISKEEYESKKSELVGASLQAQALESALVRRKYFVRFLNGADGYNCDYPREEYSKGNYRCVVQLYRSMLDAGVRFAFSSLKKFMADSSPTPFTKEELSEFLRFGEEVPKNVLKYSDVRRSWFQDVVNKLPQ